MSTEDKKPIKPLTKAEIDAELRRLFEELKHAQTGAIPDIKEKVARLKNMKRMIDDKD